MFLWNYWYVAGWSHEITRQLFTRRILGIDVLLYRDEAGQPVAMKDECPHRLSPLSMGRLFGDDVECPYHGLRFGTDGRCTLLPGQERIPAAACVDTYPVEERHGFVWIWMGDKELAKADDIPDYHWQTDPGWVGDGALIHTKSSALLIIENVLDLTHAAYLHRHTVGAEYVAYTPPETIVEDNHVAVRRVLPKVPNPSSFVKITGLEEADREQVIHFWPPAYSLLEINMWPVGDMNSDRTFHMRVLSPITPETETSHHQYLCFYRNFALENEKITEVMMEEIIRTAGEDTEMLEAQQRNFSHLDRAFDYPLNIKVDKGPIAARRMIQQLAAGQAQAAAAE